MMDMCSCSLVPVVIFGFVVSGFSGTTKCGCATTGVNGSQCAEFTGQHKPAGGVSPPPSRALRGQGGVQLSGCPPIVTRAEWGARTPKPGVRTLSTTPYYVFVHHSATEACSTKAECMREMKSFQNFHMDSRGWNDIGYSFLVGEDGNVYEGRGWDKIGAHTSNYNDKGLGFCIIGDFTSRVPNVAALNAVKQLIRCGVDNNKITASYTLRGHRDVVGQTECPGQKLHDLIKSWPHY